MVESGFNRLSSIVQSVRATSVRVLGKNGATAGATLAGGTNAGAPTSGTFEAGDFVVDHTGAGWVCTATGSPGTWNQVASSGGLTWKGAWVNTTSYSVGDVVTNVEELFIARVANTGVAPTTAGSIYAATVLSDSPTLYYRLGDAVGAGSMADSSPNNLTGGIIGSVTFGQSGALSGDVDTAISINNNSSNLYSGQTYSGPTTFTMEMWFKTSSVATQGLFGYEDQPGQTGNSLDRQMYLDTAGHLQSQGWNISGATTAYNDGNWHHLVCTATGGSTGIIYVDGVAVSSGGFASSGFGGWWKWGNCFRSGYQRFIGTIDEIAYYNGVALSAARILAHYNAGHSGSPWDYVNINPMTAPGDLIRGGTGGLPTRLVAGASNTLLQGGTTPAFSTTPTVSGEVTAADFKPSGLPGATSASRYVGATASGAPTSGTFAVGDYVVDQSGKLWICTAAGTPGTWTQVSGGGGSSLLTTKGDLYGHSTIDARVPVGADGTFLGADSSQATGLSYKFPAGIAGLATLSSALSSSVALTTAGTYYDGPSLTLTAGTWLIMANVTAYGTSNAVGNTTLTIKLWDGTTVYDSTEVTSSQSYRINESLSAIVSPTTTTTYKVSAASDQGNGNLYAVSPSNGSPPKGTVLNAVQLTGAPASGPGALMPAVRAYNSGNQSIVGGSATVVLAFDSTDYDQGTVMAQHSITTNTSRLTCQQAGVYNIVAGVGWLNQSSAGQRVLGLRVNGSTIIADDWTLANLNYFIDQTVSVQYRLNVGDYVEAFVLQDSGGTLTISPSAASPTFLSMARVDSGPGSVQANTKVQLDWTNTVTVNAASQPADTWVDWCVDLPFSVDDSNSVIEIRPSGGAIVGGPGANAAVMVQLVLDGTTTRVAGGGWVAANTFISPLAGVGPVTFTGLAVGTHTVRVQVKILAQTGNHYLTDTTGAYNMFVRVLERKQSSSPPSSTPAPAVRCHQSSNLSVSAGVWTVITFDTNVYDQGTSVVQHSTSANPSRLVCQQAGVYSIGGVFQLNSTPTNSGARIYLNGTTTLSEVFYDGAARLIEANTHYRLSAGDYVELYVYSVSANTLITTGDIRPMFWMARIDTGALPSQQWVTKSADYVILPTDYGGILADATSGNRTMTLPTAVGAWQEFTVKKFDATANTVTVATTSGQTIDGSSTYVISTQYESVTVVSNSVNWFIK